LSGELRGLSPVDRRTGGENPCAPRTDWRRCFSGLDAAPASDPNQRLEHNMLTKFIRDENGATAIEYGLIAALIAVVIIAALTVLGNNISNKFSTIAASVAAAS
jgi:pilus assembly protein Flp/PilA